MLPPNLNTVPGPPEQIVAPLTLDLTHDIPLVVDGLGHLFRLNDGATRLDDIKDILGVGVVRSIDGGTVIAK